MYKILEKIVLIKGNNRKKTTKKTIPDHQFDFKEKHVIRTDLQNSK